LNDPNGLIQYNGEYHLFYQHNPYGDDSSSKHWGHAKSRDLVHWTHLPIALAPESESYDSDGVYSGCCTIHEGTPTIVYTGVHPQVQCIATSDGSLTTWTKWEGNPVVRNRPVEGLVGFRDPFVVAIDGGYRILIGSGTENGGVVLCYRSSDLRRWEYEGVFCAAPSTDYGKNWECPAMIRLESASVLLVSPQGDDRRVRCAIGTVEGARLEVQRWDYADWGTVYYAPHCFVDESGRRIAIAWLRTPAGDGWRGTMSIPRIAELEDGELRWYPLPELSRLRTEHVHTEGVRLTANRATGEYVPTQGENLDWRDALASGRSLEIQLRARGTADAVMVLRLRAVAGLREGLDVRIDWGRGRVSVNGEHCPLAPDPDGGVTLHLFLDNCVLEVFSDYKHCLSASFDINTEYTSLGYAIVGGSVELDFLDVWRLDSTSRVELDISTRVSAD
jgi:beta-fructofuranosidase